MSRLNTLPPIMLAPNGARRTKADHPALPVTIAEVVETAAACFAVGAGALHAHIRDQNQGHLLDVGIYRELISEMALQVPDMPVQITTEAVGKYSAAHQRALVRELKPEGVSIALREMWPATGNDRAASRFYFWSDEAGIPIQHILYSTADARRLLHLVQGGEIPAPRQLLFVLGKYFPPADASPSDLDAFLPMLGSFGKAVDWAVCAFGQAEIACLTNAHSHGGKARVGFENNLLNADATLAASNEARVRELTHALEELIVK